MNRRHKKFNSRKYRNKVNASKWSTDRNSKIMKYAKKYEKL